MLNKITIAEFTKKHSFAIELGFLLAFIALYFVPNSFMVLDKIIFSFPFTHFSGAYNWLIYNDDIEQNIKLYYSIINAIIAILYISAQIYAIAYFIIKRKTNILCYIIYIIIDVLVLILLEYFTIINMALSIFILLIFAIYRWYQYSLYNGYWISPNFRISRKHKYLSNTQRIEQIEKELEELKKGNKE